MRVGIRRGADSSVQGAKQNASHELQHNNL